MWPETENFADWPSYRKIKLREVRYKQANDADQICAIQLIFTGGVQSTMFETADSKR